MFKDIPQNGPVHWGITLPYRTDRLKLAYEPSQLHLFRARRDADPLASAERRMLDDSALQSERLRRALLAAGGNRRRFV